MREIRPATADDAAIVALHRHRMFVAMGTPDDERLREMTAAFLPWARKAIAESRYLGLFATAADRVLGGVGILLIDWPPRPDDPSPLAALLLNVYTEPAQRRQGVARSLVQAALEETRLRGIRNVRLHASNDGRPLYEDLGFRPTNEMLRHDPD